MSNKQREALEAAIRDAMKKAFNFGQTYWQQADSHFVSQQNKSDITREAFNKLVNDIIRSVLAEPEQEPVTMHKVAEERDKLMQMVQEYASTWAIVGGRFDDGSAFEDAKKSKDSIFRQTAKLATISFELGFEKERVGAPSPQTPQPREWQELSEQEALLVFETRTYSNGVKGYTILTDEGKERALLQYREISAALRAKNGG